MAVATGGASGAGGGGGGGGGAVTSVAGLAGVVTTAQLMTALGLPNFGADTTVPINNSAATPVTALELIASLTTATAGSEASEWDIKLLSGGAQVFAQKIKPLATLFPSGTAGAPGKGYIANPLYGEWFDSANNRLAWSTQFGGAMTYDGGILALSAGTARLLLGGDSGVGRDASARLAFTAPAGCIFPNTSVGFFATAPVTKQTIGANVNNVAASGTTGQFDDFTNGAVYATDYAAIHATVYQLTRTVTQLSAAMRAYGLGA